MKIPHLKRRRQEGTIALACFTLLVVIIILGVTYYLVVQCCSRLPSPPGHGDDTNIVESVTVSVPAAEAKAAMQYRLVLQRTINSTDWVDIAAADWNGSPMQFGCDTNWTSLGLFRIKAIPTK
jgi:uncharacterized protein (UPF0333 family)